MDLGVRQIRSAGKGSGSIELTLPADLRDLVGLPCRMTLRDGSQPDIVLRPDLRRAHSAFTMLWHTMATVLLREVSSLPLAAFGFGLHPRFGGGERPFLWWCDGLMLASVPPHRPIAISRTLTAFAHAMAVSLRIDPGMAAGFGAACGYLATGIPADPDSQDACDLVAAALPPVFSIVPPSSIVPQAMPPATDDSGATAASDDVMAQAFWCRVTPLLIAAAELFVRWSADPSKPAILRAVWCRGRTIEMSGNQST